jgi:hypothetical protein
MRMKRAFAGNPNPATTLPRQTGTVHTAYFLLLFPDRRAAPVMCVH